MPPDSGDSSLASLGFRTSSFPTPWRRHFSWLRGTATARRGNSDGELDNAFSIGDVREPPPVCLDRHCIEGWSSRHGLTHEQPLFGRNGTRHSLAPDRPNLFFLERPSAPRGMSDEPKRGTWWHRGRRLLAPHEMRRFLNGLVGSQGTRLSNAPLPPSPLRLRSPGLAHLTPDPPPTEGAPAPVRAAGSVCHSFVPAAQAPPTSYRLRCARSIAPASGPVPCEGAARRGTRKGAQT